jgi:hypothetical protein
MIGFCCSENKEDRLEVVRCCGVVVEVKSTSASVGIVLFLGAEHRHAKEGDVTPVPAYLDPHETNSVPFA